MKIDVDYLGWLSKPRIDAVVPIPYGAETPERYRFILPGRTEVIDALVTDEGAKIDIQPDRSASHRALRDALQS